MYFHEDCSYHTSCFVSTYMHFIIIIIIAIFKMY